jgi:pyruvate/2-oxoglutarate/acetoin dehydrogenase E1 component
VGGRLGELVFDSLQSPIVRVSAEDAPIPASMCLEKEVVPQVKDIVAEADAALTPGTTIYRFDSEKR